ncbi:MAG: glutathione S-transferase N-terminal domain-containing protein [Xanthomonadales bacterium]|nr:hypothetical protein [Xanthomonadales bacterium]MCC6592512.1 glutathione S-transferase N-terminal domain-containing protein [Xanthomonadales bacterium]MCE7931508.1 hypothetical protein [Xanthomonadales bacterium PRO6]
MPQPPILTLLSSLLASSARGWRGTQVLRVAAPPKQPLLIHDRENDPDCRLLRELLTELQLDALVRPCPLGGRRWLRKLPQGARLPCLVDRDHEVTADGLRACLKHVLATYAGIHLGTGLLASLPMRLSSRLASAVRGDVGLRAQPSRAARKPLELYSFESSPYSRLVRERLCELELAWVLRSFGKEQLADWGPPTRRLTWKPWSPKPGGRRARMLAQTGKAQVPYLIDPNHGVELFESVQILQHLDRCYAR